MPRQKPTIPTDLLLAKASDRAALDDSLWILSSQAGMLLARSPDRMEEDRKAGNPPPFMKDGAAVKYRLGDVRETMGKQQAFNNTTQARLHAEKNAILGFASFNDWLDNAMPSDEWPFLMRKRGGPLDLLKSLSMADSLDGDEECGWLSLGEYLARRRDGAMEAEAISLGDRMAGPAGPITPIKRP